MPRNSLGQPLNREHSFTYGISSEVMSYKAKFDFISRNGDELNLKKGEIVVFVSTDDPSWWIVRNTRGDSGLVPKDYLEEVLYSDPANQDNTRIAPMTSRSSTQAVAKFAYRASRDDELDIQKGDIVEVLEKEGDGWWRGRVGGREGWFPANYVEDREISSSPPPSRDSCAIVCRVIAKYAFNSGNPEELRFSKGEIMEIIDQPAEDPDWWEARKQGSTSTGLIPRNYVEIVEEGASPSTLSPPAANSNGNDERYPFCSESWYHGKMSRGHAENILQQNARNGQFLVRASETKVRQLSNR